MPGKRISLYVAWCDKHQKKLYTRRRDAKRIAREHPGEHKVAYRCTLRPHLWHVGEIPPQVLSGEQTRIKIRGK